MNKTDRELLSKILDEDISEFEIQRILRAMRSNSDLRTKLQRYNIIGHAMRGQLPVQLDHDFYDDVMSKLSDEEKLDSGLNKSKRSFTDTKIKTAIGLAIAASVAVISFVTFQNIVQLDTNTDNSTVVAEQAFGESDVYRIHRKELHNVISNSEATAEFNSYVVNHAEYASPRASMPHVRIVGYD